MERVQIFIDGGNFYHLVLKKLNIKEANFSFENFAKFIADNRIITDKGKRYYVGTIRELLNNPKTKISMAHQLSFLARLRNNNWQTKTSKLRFREEKVMIDERTVHYQEILNKGIKQIEYCRFREKGIDVKIATDLIIGALDNQYDTAIIASSDTDLVPAIDLVRNRFKKRVEYVGFSILDEVSPTKSVKPSSTLIIKTDTQRILVKSDLEKFIQQDLKI